MYNRKKLLILGSATILIMAAAIKYSYQSVEVLKSNPQSESSQTSEVTASIGEYNDSRDKSTYSRGNDEREYDAEPDMDFHDTDQEQNHVESKLRIEDSGEAVKELQQKLKKMGFFTEEATGFFGIVTNDAVVDFQVQMGLMPDGIVGEETLKAIDEAVAKGVTALKPQENQDQPQNGQASSAKEKAPSTNNTTKSVPAPQQSKSEEGKIELLSWFGGAENVFSIGSVAKVIDVDSGLSFNAKRTYGYNHADVEALTAEDAQIMKKIAGGSWNWTRRAVIVEVNGRRLAASMAPMPHAGLDSKAANVQVSGRSGGYGTGVNLDTVKGNGMDGHFDIHFYNSKTHASNKVDSQHQAMVQKAYRSGK